MKDNTGLIFGIAGSILLIGIASSASAQNVSEIPRQAADSNKEDNKKEEAQSNTPYDPNTNPIYVKFQKMSVDLLKLYGKPANGTPLYSMTNDEINDAYSYMYEYADLANGGKNKKPVPDDLKNRIIAISKVYKIFI
jgi:hypothetical protein